MLAAASSQRTTGSIEQTTYSRQQKADSRQQTASRNEIEGEKVNSPSLVECFAPHILLDVSSHILFRMGGKYE